MKNMPSLKVLVTLVVAFSDLNLLTSASRSRSRHSSHRTHERIHHRYGPELFSALGHRSLKHTEPSCDDLLSDQLKSEIDGYRDVVERIIHHIKKKEPGETYRQVSEFVETFGPRYIDTTPLLDAIKDRMSFLKELVPSDVALQASEATLRERGWSKVKLLNALYNGANRTVFDKEGRIGVAPHTTKVGNFTALLLYVKSLSDLESVSAKVPGTVVLFDVDVGSREEFLAFAHEAAPVAEEMGAVAVLVKTINIPEHHEQRITPYLSNENMAKIPVFEITVPDADFISRKHKPEGWMEVYVESEVYENADTPSSNIIAEIRGHTLPDEALVVTGHIDTWDIGQEYIDDACGAGITWRVLEVLKHLHLTARRSIRIALYTDERLGFREYDKRLNDFRFAARATQFVLKSDARSCNRGVLGLSTSVKNPETLCIINRTLQLFDSIGATELDVTYFTSDPEQWKTYGVPTGSIIDRMMQAPGPQLFSQQLYDLTLPNEVLSRMMSMDDMTALWTGLAYVLADLEVKLPHSMD